MLSRACSVRWFARCGPASLPLHTKGPGDVSPGLALSEYMVRRQALADALPPRSCAIICASPVTYMGPDVPIRFRQSVDFSYLTGYPEEDAVLLLSNHQPGRAHTTLCVLPKDPALEVWDGVRIGPDAARSDFGFSASDVLSALPKHLGEHLERANNIFFDQSSEFPAKVRGDLEHATRQPRAGQQLANLAPHIHRLRIVKSPAETSLMRKSCQIASFAFVELMRATRAGVAEKDLDALMEYTCRTRGATRLSFPSVVASGARACTLHYIQNRGLLGAGEMVFVDAGCEYNGYASDISRTWPVSRAFNPAQRDVYEAVLRVQQQCIALCVPDGVRTMRHIHYAFVRMAIQMLFDLKLVDPSVAHSRDSMINAFQTLCIHSIGHHLGMDTHDVQSVAGDAILQPGMAVTIEPGLYIPDSLEFPKEMRGMGFRIEDDILITDKGPEILTRDCPKTIAEIEAVLQAD